jgi:hypothetical protein
LGVQLIFLAAMGYFSHFRVRNLTAAFIVGLAAAALLAHDNRSLSPHELGETTRKIRQSWFESHEHLQGRIRKGTLSVPFRIVLRSAFVELSFAETSGRFRVPVGGDMKVQKFQEGEWVSNDSFLITSPIADTLVSFEDLAFRFLDWPDPKEVETAMVGTKTCTVIRFVPPLHQSGYTAADLFLEENSLIPLRLIYYGSDGRESKRFDPVKLKRVGEDWIVKSIRVTGITEPHEKNWEPTYIEFETDASGPPK